MKLFKLALLFIITAPFLTSCRPDPETEQQVQIELIDAAAAAEILMAGAESGVLYIYPWGTLATWATAGAYGAQMSREAAAAQSRSYPTTNYLLPTTYYVSGNPYECVGDAHNRNLAFFENSPGSAEAVSNLDEDEVRECIDNYTQCNEEANTDSIMGVIQSETFSNFYNGLDREKYTDKTLTEVLVDKMEYDTTGVANYLLNFISDYNKEFGNSTNYLGKISYINDEITRRLTSSEYPNRKTQKLVFLTVLKHSVYFWK